MPFGIANVSDPEGPSRAWFSSWTNPQSDHNKTFWQGRRNAFRFEEYAEAISILVKIAESCGDKDKWLDDLKVLPIGFHHYKGETMAFGQKIEYRFFIEHNNDLPPELIERMREQAEADAEERMKLSYHKGIVNTEGFKDVECFGAVWAIAGTYNH